MKYLRFLSLLLVAVLLVACPGPVTPEPKVEVTVSPNTVTLAPGGTQTFSATVENAEDDSVTWSAEEGTITDGGVYTAPEGEGENTVTATSVEDTGAKGEATVTITRGPLPPEITSFGADPASGEAPLSTTFSWELSDANGDALSCTLDVDDDGEADYTLTDCLGTTTQGHVYSDAGSYTATLSVNDGSAEAETTVTVAEPAGLSVEAKFDPSEASGIIGLSFDTAKDEVWVFSTNLTSYTRDGTFVAAIDRPGESADDADTDFTPEAMTLGTTEVPANTLFFFNGETGTTDVYAVDTTDGTVLASLETAFGANHVVGGAYHPGRDTFFLLTDRLDATPSTIAEIDPQTGEVLGSFGTGSDAYTIFYGDIEVAHGTGNLLLVTSDEAAIRELTATGDFVRELELPAGVSRLSGIALDDERGEAFVSGVGGAVWRLSGF